MAKSSVNVDRVGRLVSPPVATRPIHLGQTPLAVIGQVLQDGKAQNLLAQEWRQGDLAIVTSDGVFDRLPIPGEQAGHLLQRDDDGGLPAWKLNLTGNYFFRGNITLISGNGTVILDTWAEGSIGYADASSVLTELALGANVPPQVLGVNVAETAPQWQTASVYLAHNLLSATHTDTAPATPVLGDLIVADGTPNWSALAVGGPGAVLVVNAAGNAPVWVVPVPAAGQLLHFNGTDTVFTTTMTYTDTSRIQQFVGGDASVFGAAGSSLFIGENTAEPQLDVSMTVASRIMDVAPTSRTITDTRSGWIVMPDTTIITMNVLNGSIGGIFASDATFQFSQSGLAVGAGNLFRNSAIFTNTSGIAASFGSQYTFVNTARYRADGQAISSSFVRDLLHQPTFEGINGGALVVATANAVYSQPIVQAGATVTNHRDFEMGPGVVNGVLTNRSGLFAPAAIAGTNVSVVESILAALANRFFINHTGTAVSRFGGDVVFNARVDINNGIALGGGATALLGTIGGSGPTVAAQNLWVEIDVAGVPTWVAGWR